MKTVTIELLVKDDVQKETIEMFCRELNTFAEHINNDSIPFINVDLSELKGEIKFASVKTQEAPQYDFTNVYDSFDKILDFNKKDK